MSAVVKISTPKAIKLLEDGIKAKKAELAKYKSDCAQHKKDIKKWKEDMAKEVKSKPIPITGVVHRYNNGNVEVTFTFKPSRPYPSEPENPRVQVKDGRYSYTRPQYDVFEEQIKQSEQLLKMLKLTNEDTVSASVYKDLASLL